MAGDPGDLCSVFQPGDPFEGADTCTYLDPPKYLRKWDMTPSKTGTTVPRTSEVRVPGRLQLSKNLLPGPRGSDEKLLANCRFLGHPTPNIHSASLTARLLWKIHENRSIRVDGSDQRPEKETTERERSIKVQHW